MNQIDSLFDYRADDAGHIEGYGAVFSTPDSAGEIFHPKAFDGVLKERDLLPVPMRFEHQQTIGTWDEIRADSKGLYVAGEVILDADGARGAYALVRKGAVRGLSIGFIPDFDTMSFEGDTRTVKNVKRLGEVSLVTVPANRNTKISQVRALLDDEDLHTRQEIERALRIDLDLSGRQAKRLFSDWMRRKDDSSSADIGQIDAIVGQLQQLKRELSHD